MKRRSLAVTSAHAHDPAIGAPRPLVLSDDFDDPGAYPYFLWDAPMTVAELRHKLATLSEPERLRLLGKVLREAKDTDVWRFTTPQEVAAQFDRLRPHLGRRRGFWDHLLRIWREAGLLHEPVLESGDRVLREVAAELGASIEAKISAPDFKRYLLATASDACVVDLVHDRAPAGDAPKVRFGAIVVDPPEEILANKLCTLLSRNELRDLVDVLALERAGFPIEGAIPLASRKDGGLTPAQLSWVLSQITIGDDAVVPGGVSAAELRRFLLELQGRLGRMAWPS